MNLKNLLSVSIKIAISVGLIWLFLRQIELGDLVGSAGRISLQKWALGVLLFALSNVLGAVQWAILLRGQNIRLPFRTVLTIYFVGVFFNNFLVSNIGGDAVRVYDLRSLTGRTTAGFAAVFMDRFIGLFTLIVFCTAAFWMDPNLWTPGLLWPMAGLAASIVGVLCFGFSRRLSGWTLEVCGKFLPGKFILVLGGIRDGFIAYRHAYGLLGRVGVVAAAVQLSRVAVYFVVGSGMGLGLSYLHFLVFIPLIAIVAAVPISFGGIGVRENLGSILFARVGVAGPDALAMMFLGYLAGITASLAGGIAFVVRRSKEGEEAH
ncbi:MAG: hypothetical protein CME26_12680 [Gemmatimonadetes bacterium]|nr:hypothetical protein [Gemmatimonadota bacterium]